MQQGNPEVHHVRFGSSALIWLFLLLNCISIFPCCATNNLLFFCTQLNLYFLLNPTPHINKQAFIYKVNCIWNFSTGDLGSCSSSLYPKSNLLQCRYFSQEHCNNFFTWITLTLTAECSELLDPCSCRICKPGGFGEHGYKSEHLRPWNTLGKLPVYNSQSVFSLPSPQCMLG